MVHKCVKQGYTEFSMSPKRKSILDALIEAIGGNFKSLHHLFEIRFINSEYVCLNILHNLPILYQYLKDAITNLQFATVETKQ